MGVVVNTRWRSDSQGERSFIKRAKVHADCYIDQKQESLTVLVEKTTRKLSKTIKKMAAIKHLRLTSLVVNQNLSGMLAKTLTTLSMSQAWSTKKVVPDVIDDVPPNKLGVQYPEITVNEGNVIRPRQAKNPPAVSWGVQDESSLFALCMTDPDAPSRSKPTQREWHHWLVVNIPGNNIEKGETLSQYIGAGPPKDTGLHRYIFLLYAYPKRINFNENILSNTSPDGRANFSIRKFAEKYNLGRPIAGNFFVAEFDSYVPELYKQLGVS